MITLSSLGAPPMNPPLNPAGEYRPQSVLIAQERSMLIDELAALPARVLAVVQPLSSSQLDTRYRNWTVRQIVHHLPDSHLHSYIRFKWALTEDHPTIKPYDESRCSEDAKTGSVQEPLALLVAIHARWVQLLRTMQAEQFARTFYHPESKKTLTLDEILGYYTWHGRHHLAQIQWVISQK
jgi:uncharacterized damage-inducible protein DinB